jgi:hypothetical protein
MFFVYSILKNGSKRLFHNDEGKTPMSETFGRLD